MREFLISSTYAKYTTYLILLHLIALTIYGESNYKAPHYAVSSSLLLLPPSWVQIFSSKPTSQTLSHHVLLLCER